MISCRKSLSETCITLLCDYYCFWHKRGQKGILKELNFFHFHPILMQFFREMFILMGYWWSIKNVMLFRKGNQITKFCKIEKSIEFSFFIQFWCVSFLTGCVEGIRCVAIFPLSFTNFEINSNKRDWKEPISKIWKHYKNGIAHVDLVQSGILHVINM